MLAGDWVGFKELDNTFAGAFIAFAEHAKSDAEVRLYTSAKQPSWVEPIEIFLSSLLLLCSPMLCS